MRSTLLLINVVAYILCSEQIQHIKNITSLLNTTDIEIIDENKILVSTSGGIYTYNYSNISDDTNFPFNNYTSILEYVNIESLTIENDKIWVASSTPYGNIQVLDEDYQLLSIIDWIDDFTSITKIVLSDKYAFAIAIKDNNNILVQYSNNESPSYLNRYNLSININNVNTINDLIIIDEVLYIGTDIGLLSLDLQQNAIDLIQQDDWVESLEGQNITNLINNNNQLEHASQTTDFCFKGICSNTVSNVVKIVMYLDDYYILSDNALYLLSESTNTYIEKFSIPIDIQSSFKDIEIINDQCYFAIENHGIMVTDLIDFDIKENIIPNSIFKNDFVAIDIFEDKKLAGISKDGGFIIDNVFTDNNNLIKNFYSFNANDNAMKYPNQSEDYFGKRLPYIVGGKEDLDLLFDSNGKLYFINNGIFLNKNGVTFPANQDYIDAGAEYISGLIQLDTSTLEIIGSWGDDVFTGMNCMFLDPVFFPSCDKNYTVLNQILYDNQDNLWVINSHSEGNINKPLCIYDNNNWSYIEDDVDENAYLLTEIAFDLYNNVWVAYQEQDYSPGGIRLIQLDNDNYDWFNSNPLTSSFDNCNNTDIQLNTKNVWSIDIGKDKFNNTILWTLSDNGVMGYIIHYNLSQHFNNLSIEADPIRCDFYFSEISFDATSKIRVDKQNNAWISSNDGLRVIKSNGEIWPENYTINQETTQLLSNKIYNLIFDDFGHVYVATDQGISIFKTIFSKDKQIEDISVSPNPFIIGKDEGITITNFPANSTIQILNLSGRVVKKFQFEEQTAILNWNGKGDNGQYLNTGIYLVAAFSKDKGTGVTKLAIIRN